MSTRLVRILVAVGIFVALGLVPVSIPTGDDVTIPGTKTPQPIQPFTAQTVVTQQFPATGTTIREVTLQLGVLRRGSHGTLHISMTADRGGSWQPLGETLLATDDLSDGQPTIVPFSSPLTVTVGQLLRLSVQPDAGAATAIVWLVNPTEQRDQYTLTVNDAPQTGVARFGVTYEPRRGRLFMLVGAVFGRITVLMNGFWRGVFLVSVALFVVAMCILLWRLPDEAADDPIVDSAEDEAILRPVGTSGAPVLHSGQEGQG